MQMIDFWIVRKGEDARKVAPEVAEAISRRHDNKKCLFCGDGHETGAVIAFCWPDDDIYTAEICMDCAKHSDEKLAEMTQQEVFPERVAGLREFTQTADELEALGLLETVGIDPVTRSKRRRITAKGRELLAGHRPWPKH
jgi:hypothetical protein